MPYNPPINPTVIKPGEEYVPPPTGPELEKIIKERELTPDDFKGKVVPNPGD